MTDWMLFNIHDYATMGVERHAPTAPLLREMFEPFLVNGTDRIDLEITGTVEDMPDASYGSISYRYTDSSVYMAGTGVQIIRHGDRFRLNGQRELLVMALPLLDRILVQRGAAMIHAATVEYKGHGISLPAWGETGKTSTIAKLVKREGIRFMGDDWAFLTRDQELLGYAKPMFIKPHHRQVYPHLFQNKRKPLVPSMFTSHLSSLATAVHPVITRYPRVAGFTRKWSPEHMIVTPRQAFPSASFSDRAPLALSVALERFDGSQAVMKEVDSAWLVSRLIGNYHYEIGAPSQDVITAMGATGLVPLDRSFAEKQEVLERAVRDKPAFLLQVPKALTPDQASDIIVEQLYKAFAVAGIA